MKQTLLVFAFASLALTSKAQFKPAPKHHAEASDASWIRAFAAPETVHAEGEVGGRENELNNNPRFTALLRDSLPQRAQFWGVNGRFPAAPEVVHEFLGVPGDAILDQNRYVTADGCVPHDCLDRGMVWIDTEAHPMTVIFAALPLVASNDSVENGHLWLYTSKHLDYQALPPAFLASLARWQAKKETDGVPRRVLLTTIVLPSGEMTDLSPNYLAQQTTGAKP